MSGRQGIRRAAGVLLGAAAALEFGSVGWVLVDGPFDLRLGPIPILARDASKPFLVAVVIGSLAVWLLEPSQTAATQSRLAMISRAAAGAAVVVSFATLVAPVFLPDFLVGHDGGVHQTYAFLLYRGLRQGQFPVRWVEGITPGIGQPLFNYYQVGFYYLVALIHRCGPSLSLALKLTIAGLWAGGGVFMFLLCRPLGVLPATLAAAVFTGSPYLMLDAYVRTAYPEFSAVAFAPGVLWAIDQTLRTGRLIFVCALALTTALLLLSHLPTAVIVAPVAAAYLLGSWIVYRHPIRSIGLVSIGAVLGAVLAAFYVVPALTELPAVHLTKLTSAYFDFHRHFVQPKWWVDWSWGYGGSGDGAADQMSVQIGIVQWIVLAAAILLLGVPWIGRRALAPRKAIAGWLAVVAAALLMMTAASTGVWDRIKPLAFIQFPWRFLMLPSLACGVLAGAVLSAIRPRTVQALVVLIVVTLQWYVTRDYREMAWTRERAVIPIDGGYWPTTANATRWVFREAAYDPLSVTNDAPALTPGRWTVIDGQGDVRTITESDARLQLQVHAATPIRLVINSPYFPGWGLRLDGQPVDPGVLMNTGYLSVTVPAGDHRVVAAFGRTRVRAAAELISLIGLVAWLSLMWRAWTRRRSVRMPVNAVGP